MIQLCTTVPVLRLVTSSVRFTFKQKGKPVGETGSILTLAMQKSQAGWRITGWSWAKH